MKSTLLVYFMTYGGSVASLFNPFIGLLVFICFAIVHPARIFWYTLPQGSYSQTIAIAMLVGWALNGFGHWNMGRARAVTMALVAFWAWSLLSALLAPSADATWVYMDNLTNIVLPFVVGMTLIKTHRQILQLVWVVGLSLGYVALNENQIYYSRGIYVGDNLLAHTFAMGTAVIFFMGLTTSVWWKRLGAFALAGCSANAVYIHMSRGAMLGLCCAGVMAFLVLPKKPGFLMLYVVALVAGFALAGPQVRDEFASIFVDRAELDVSASSRFEFWKAMAKCTKENPLFGVGPRQWPIVGHQYGAPKNREGHGAWQQLAAEVGIPGVSFVLLFYGICVFRLARIISEHKSSDLAWAIPIARIVIVSVPAWVFQQVVGSFYLEELPYFVCFIGAATIKVASLEMAHVSLPRQQLFREIRSA